MSFSSAPAVRSRRRSSSQRPVSKKNTNMVSESKYTSRPKGPAGSNVPSELTPKATSIASATGKSMLMRRSFKSSHAFLKNGPHENSTTGMASTHCAQRSRYCVCASIPPGAVK